MIDNSVNFFLNTNTQSSVSPTAEVGIEQVTVPSVIGKIADVALQNKEAGLILASGIATSIILYVISKSVAEIITAWKSKG